MKIKDYGNLLQEKSTSDILDSLLEEEITNSDVYGSDTHKEAEEVEGTPVLDKKETKNVNATLEKKPTVANTNFDTKDIYPSEDHKESDDVSGVVVTEKYSDFRLLQILEANDYEPTLENLEILKEEIKAGNIIIEEVEEAEDESDGELESKDVVESEVDDKKPEEPAVEEEESEVDDKKPEKPAVEDKKVEEEEPSEKTDEVTVDDALTEGLSSIFSLISSINESIATIREESQVANGPEISGAKELKNEATLEKKPTVATTNIDTADIYPSDEHIDGEEVGEVVVEGEGVTVDKTPETANSDIDTADIYPSDEHIDGEEVGEVVVESAATKDTAPTEISADIDTSDVYTSDLHKAAEDVVGIIVEAAAKCHNSGKPATKCNITKTALPELEKILCNKNKNPKASDLRESVKYKSIKEACLLDEDYFTTDSYTCQTSAEKQSRLVEQVSLLLARENLDPLYDELLKESIQAQRLQEAIIRKYSDEAGERARTIYERF